MWYDYISHKHDLYVVCRKNGYLPWHVHQTGSGDSLFICSFRCYMSLYNLQCQGQWWSSHPCWNYASSGELPWPWPLSDPSRAGASGRSGRWWERGWVQMPHRQPDQWQEDIKQNKTDEASNSTQPCVKPRAFMAKLPGKPRFNSHLSACEKLNMKKGIPWQVNRLVGWLVFSFRLLVLPISSIQFNIANI